MGVTSHVSKRTEQDRLEADKAIAEFLNKGGKIKEIPEGDFTEARDMKYKFRKPASPKKNKED